MIANVSVSPKGYSVVRSMTTYKMSKKERKRGKEEKKKEGRWI